jgi:hypothetical protein
MAPLIITWEGVNSLIYAVMGCSFPGKYFIIFFGTLKKIKWLTRLRNFIVSACGGLRRTLLLYHVNSSSAFDAKFFLAANTNTIERLLSAKTSVTLISSVV